MTAILDVGCGFRSSHTKRGTIGIDLHRGLAEIIVDAHYLPFQSSTFDGCYAYALLEHVNNPLRVLEEIRFVLKVGGWLKILVPTDSKLRADHLVRILNFDIKAILREFKQLPSEGHKWQFSERNLSRVLARHKFAVKRVEYPPVPVIYGKKGRILTRLGFLRHPHLVVHAEKRE